MTRRLAALAACAALLTAACGGSGGGPHDGGKDTLPGAVPKGVSFAAPAAKAASAPAFSLSLLDGTRVSGATLWKDRPVVVVFFASWCSECVKEQHALAPLVSRYKDAVTFIGVAAQDKPAAVRAYLNAHDVTYPVGIDSQLTVYKQYAIRTPPAVALISRGGKLLRGWTNAVPADTLDAQLKDIVKR